MLSATLEAHSCDVVEMSVTVKYFQTVMLSAGGNEDISSGCRNARLPAVPREVGGSLPDGGRSRDLLQIPLKFPQEALLAGAVGPVP